VTIVCIALIFVGTVAGVAAMVCSGRCDIQEWGVPYLNPVRWSIRHFVKALADGDAKALAEHVQLPFERRYPIPKIKTMDEFVAAIPSLLGEDAVKRLSKSSAFRDWGQVGGSYEHDSVGIWVTDDTPTLLESITELTPAETALWETCAKREIAMLHPSLREGVARPILSFVTEDSAFRGRIDLLGEKLDARACEPEAYKYRLAIYKAERDITSAPDKIVMCKYGHEGSPGYDSYTSEDGQYQVTVNYCGPRDFAEMNFYRPGIAEDDDKASRAKSCEWR
jgi:hypothetical protein